MSNMSALGACDTFETVRQARGLNEACCMHIAGKITFVFLFIFFIHLCRGGKPEGGGIVSRTIKSRLVKFRVQIWV